MIIGQKKGQIAFIDCFAGPWLSQSPDLSDTSPGIALQTMRECREALAKIGHHVRMRALFVEAEKDRCEQLQAFLQEHSTEHVTGEVRCQTFQSDVRGLAEWIAPREFAFVFVDPFGWKKVIAPATLAPLLRRPNTELLINFMSNFIRLAAAHANQTENLVEILGEDYEELDDQGRVDRYRQKVSDAGAVPSLPRVRTASLQIDHAQRDAAVYYMVYTTRNATGLLTFLEQAEKTDEKQRVERHQRRLDSKGHGDLFGAKSLVLPRLVRRCPRDAWLQSFPEVGVPVEFSAERMADVAERAGCSITALYKAGLQLMQEGILKNCDAKGRRTAKPVHWRTREHLVRLR